VQRISKCVTSLEENWEGDAQWRVALQSHDPASHVFAAQGGLTTWKTFTEELITMVNKAAASSAPLPV
jgi:fluoride ion exporter CrcB/FEX